MDKKFVALISTVIILLILALNYNFLITGLSNLAGINVAIQEKISGKLLLALQPFLELGKTQNIYAEFINTGTNPVTAKIEEKIYIYANGTLKPIAYYYDISVPLNPGMRRSYNTVFVPPSVGLYYIRARTSYDNKIIETWGVFSVYYPPAPVPPILPPIAPPAAPPAPVGIGVPQLSLEYPEKVKVSQGGSTLINITVRNVGDVTLHNLKLYISTTSLINFEINPKQIASLALNKSAIFLISIDVPLTTPEGLYSFDFELMSDEIKEGRKIILEVVAAPVSEEEEIRQTILNYEFLISEIEQEIISASLEGFDVTLANQSLNSAKLSLDIARDYVKLKKFEEAKRELEKVKESLEDAVFQLASITLYVYKPPAFIPWLILLLIILIIVGILAYYYYKKRRKRRPKILRALGETETEK